MFHSFVDANVSAGGSIYIYGKKTKFQIIQEKRLLRKTEEVK